MSLTLAPEEFAVGASSLSSERKARELQRLLAVFLCGTFAFLDLYCTQPMLPLIASVFHVSETAASWTISACTLGVAVSAALLAIFGERLARKQTIVRSMFALAAAALLTSTAPGLTSLAFWRVLQGLVTPGIFIITIAYITEEWPALQVPRAMSIYVAGTVFGGFVGRFSGGLIAAHLGWRAVFILLGVLGLIGATLTAKLLPAASPRTSAHARTGSVLTPIWQNGRNPRLLATFAIGFCMLFTLVGTFSYVAFYLAAPPFSLSTAALSWLFSVYLIGLVATLLSGPVLPRFGLRNGMLVAVGLGLTGVALTLVHSLVMVAAGLAVASSGVFIAQTCANSFLRDAAPAGSRVSAAGMYICSYYIGGTAGGVLPGWAYRHSGWPGAVATIACGLLLAGATTWFGWPRATRAPVPV